MFDRSPIGVVISDLDRRIRYANPEAMKLIGVTAYEGHRLDEVFVDQDAQEVLNEQLGRRQEGLIGGYRVTIRRLSDRRPIRVDITGVPRTDQDGRVVGALGYFRDAETDTLIDAIHRANGETHDHRNLMREVASLLAEAFAADMVIASQYSQDLGHSNPFFVFRSGEQKRQIEWRKRWIALNEAQQAYTRNAKTVAIPRLSETLSTGIWRNAHDDPFLRAILDGQDSALSRPIKRGGVLVGRMTLLARRSVAFGDRDRELIDKLPVDATMLNVLDSDRQRRERERFQMLRELTRSVTIKSACQTLARRLVDIFGWSHVSVFRVDYAERRIHLIAQHSPGRDAIWLKEDYQQSLDSGIMGRLVATRRAINVGNVQSDPHYVALDPDHQVCSELCCPINFGRNDKVRWIINVEDRDEEAFSENEYVWLGEIAAEVGALMERISDLHFLTECFRESTDPIVVTGPNYEIRKVNLAAARLLGYSDPKEVRDPFAMLFDTTPNFERLLRGQDGDLGEFPVRHRDSDTPAALVQVSMQSLPEHLGGKIFVLKDLRAIRRAVELEFLGVASYEIAVQTRAPLALATAALERLRASLHAEVAADVDKVLRLLGRVRQGYMRLALYNRHWQPASEIAGSVNLIAELRAVVADLPDSEQQLVRVAVCEPSPVIRGDHFQITFVLETLLAALIRGAPEEEPVVAMLERKNDRVELSLSGYLPLPQADDPVAARLGSTLRADVRLSRELIRRFMTHHGGAFSERSEHDGRVQFLLEFPLAREQHP